MGSSLERVIFHLLFQKQPEALSTHPQLRGPSSTLLRGWLPTPQRWALWPLGGSKMGQPCRVYIHLDGNISVAIPNQKRLSQYSMEEIMARTESKLPHLAGLFFVDTTTDALPQSRTSTCPDCGEQHTTRSTWRYNPVQKKVLVDVGVRNLYKEFDHTAKSLKEELRKTPSSSVKIATLQTSLENLKEEINAYAEQRSK